ncbi:MAG: DNA recombination protein RmuC [Candidatus Neomarinimicrobiota bacterium]
MHYILLGAGLLFGALIVYIVFQFVLKKKAQEAEAHRELLSEANNQIARLETEKLGLEREKELLREQSAKDETLQKTLSERFKNLANEIFDEKSKKNTDTIKLVLAPIEKDIDQFRKKIEELNSGTTHRMASLTSTINELKELNKDITEETANLTKALKGDVKKQGNWGELILERLLEISGLKKGIEYETQSAFNDEEGRRVLDILIKLPENKHLIIDSKVSLVDYERLTKAETPEEIDRCKKALSISIKTHVDDLASKHYQTIKGLNSPDYVFMFIPIEGAFYSIFEEDMSLYQYAINKNVMIVSPTTLLASLRTVSALWQQENQTKNALEIASESGKLLDKFVSFYDDFQKIGRQLQTVQNSYDDAENKLKTGKGNLVSRAQKIQDMGATPSKQLPKTTEE